MSTKTKGAQMAWLELMQGARKVPHLLGMAAFVRTVALNVPSYVGICVTVIPCLLSSTETPEGFASGCPCICTGFQARLPVLQRWGTYIIRRRCSVMDVREDILEVWETPLQAMSVHPGCTGLRQGDAGRSPRAGRGKTLPIGLGNGK